MNIKREQEFYRKSCNEIFDLSKNTIVQLDQVSYSHDLMSLLVSDLHKDTFAVCCEYFDLSKCVNQAFNIIMKPARVKNLQLIGEVDHGSHMSIIRNLKGDGRRLVQILVNSMVHALSSIEDFGTIRVLVRLKDIVNKGL